MKRGIAPSLELVAMIWAGSTRPTTFRNPPLQFVATKSGKDDARLQWREDLGDKKWTMEIENVHDQDHPGTGESIPDGGAGALKREGQYDYTVVLRESNNNSAWPSAVGLGPMSFRYATTQMPATGQFPGGPARAWRPLESKSTLPVAR